MNIEERLERIERLTLIAAKEALTSAEAAEYLGLSINTIYQLCHRHKIPYYKSAGGKTNYFKKEEVTNWALSQRISSNEYFEAKAAAFVMNARKGGRR
jgi:excisionase family DNA binding protein